MFKLTATSLVAVLAATVAAQSIPKYQSFPAACASQCASTIETSDLCYKEYTTGQDIVSCFCSGAPSSSEVSTCSSCLSSNGASELAGVLSAIPDACATYTKTCQKECGFDTCASSDIACQCSESYLASIYQCASCNTRNGNTGATGLTDYEALANSCGNQNFTVPATTSSALPSPTGQASYSAPSLAASASSYSMGASSVTGFVISADGTTTTVAVSSTPSVRASSVSSASSGAVSAASSSARASSSSAASASSARASSSAASGSAIPAAATAPASGALALGVNAVGMIGAMFGMIAVL